MFFRWAIEPLLAYSLTQRRDGTDVVESSLLIRASLDGSIEIPSSIVLVYVSRIFKEQSLGGGYCKDYGTVKLLQRWFLWSQF